MIDLKGLEGSGVEQAIGAAGISLQSINGELVVSDETAAQNIIDNFDPLPGLRIKIKSKIIKEASRRSAQIYPFIDPNSEQAIALYEFAVDLYMATIPAARATLSGRLLQFKNIHDAAQDAISDVNAITEWKTLAVYDAVNTPSWPA